LPEAIQTYYEPFIGGGALFFHLSEGRRFQRAVVNDFNPEIVNCYRVIRDSLKDLIEELKALVVSREAFLALRSIDPSSLSPTRRAARTIYLNKTGFNGLYRLNRQGRFNVPWGDYRSPKILDELNLQACSTLLNKSVTLLEGDFLQAVGDAHAGDVVYFDPPYVPLTPTSNFKNYTKEGFTLVDQQRLALCFTRLTTKGVTVLLSNSDTPLVHELYDDFERHVVRMRRNINSKGDSRGCVQELIVEGVPPKPAEMEEDSGRR
jgi:DNA adenine methylase